jgi:hypothetical protein
MLILNFTYPLICLRVPPVEYHWSIPFKFSDQNLLVSSMRATFPTHLTILHLITPKIC